MPKKTITTSWAIQGSHVTDHATLHDRYTRSAWITDYGAAGDGVTDCSAKIQEAIGDLGTAGGTLYFPKGKYRCNSPVVISGQNVRLAGEGNGSYNGSDCGSILLAGTPGMILLDFSHGDANQHNGPALENLALRDTTGQTATMVRLRMCSRWTLRNVSFNGAALALDIDAVTLAGGDASWGMVDQCFFNLCAQGILTHGVASHTIIGGAFTACGVGVASDPYTPNVKIIGTKFDGGVGVHFKGYGSEITSCGFEDCTTAIRMDGEDGIDPNPSGRGNRVIGGMIYGYDPAFIGIEITAKARETKIVAPYLMGLTQTIIDNGADTVVL